MGVSKATWDCRRLMWVQSPVITVFDFKEPLNEEVFIFLVNCGFLKRNFQAEDEIEQRNMLLLDTCNNGGIDARHDD